MDSNNMYQNQQQTGTEPENNQFANNNGNGYQNNYNNYNNNYQQYPYSNYNGNYQMPYQQESQLDLEEPMKMSEWLISFLIMMIPCIGIIMVFVWAFGGTEKKSKSNFFKAFLIWIGILIAFSFVMSIFVVALGLESAARWY